MLVLILSLALAFTVSGLCSLMEASLLSMTPGQVAQLVRRSPKAGLVFQRLKNEIERPIAVILTLNTAAHTIGATVAGSEFAVLFGHAWIALFSILFTYIMLQYTEILPKTLGVRFNMQVASLMAYPLQWLVTAMAPLIYLVHLVNRPFESRRPKGSGAPKAGMEEITALAGLARLANIINPHQERIISGATRLSGLTVEDVMVPLEQVTFISTDDDLASALVTAHMDPHTRFPIIKGTNRDEVQGYINFKELVYRTRTNPGNPTMLGVVRPVYFVQKDLSCAELIQAFVDEHIHMAIVRDAAGHTVGLVTLEDVIEALVGPLEDEFDRLPKMAHQLNGGIWLVGGGTPMTELVAKLGIKNSSGHSSLSAWVKSQLGGTLEVGASCSLDGHNVTIRRIRRGNVFEAVITPAGISLPPAWAPDSK